MVLCTTGDICAYRCEVGHSAHIDITAKGEVQTSLLTAVHLLGYPCQVIRSGAYVFILHEFGLFSEMTAIVLVVVHILQDFLCICYRVRAIEICTDSRCIIVLFKFFHLIIVGSSIAQYHIEGLHLRYHSQICILSLVDIHECLAYAAYEIIFLLIVGHGLCLCHLVRKFLLERSGIVGSSIVIQFVKHIVIEHMRCYFHHVLELGIQSLCGFLDGTMIDETGIAQESIVVSVICTQCLDTQCQRVCCNIHQDAVVKEAHAYGTADTFPRAGTPSHGFARIILAQTEVLRMCILLLFSHKTGIGSVEIVVILIGIDKTTIVICTRSTGVLNLRIT